MKVQTKRLIADMLLCVVALAWIGCGGGSGKGADEENDSLRMERQRVEHALFMDSTSLTLQAGLDTIGGRASLDNLTAEAWLLVDDATGLIVSSRNASRRMFMASLTKMMTCLLALEHEADGDTVTITDDVFVTRDSRVRLGDSYRMHDLICEMMLQSDNDAAYALAKHVGGDTLRFCEMMNAKAAYLHMDSTHFANPNGMPNAANYSTARDLMVLMRYCLRDSAFASIVSTAEMDIPLTDGRHLPSTNTNLLLSRYEGCIGVKTGYTRQAGSCLASAARRNGVTLCLVLLNSRSRSSRFSESAALLDYGFRVVETVR